jgi:transcriptional regulator with XRE-family HTH domain
VSRVHPLQGRMTDLRLNSRWPRLDEFARQIALSRSSYEKYEAGERLPSLKTLHQIAVSLGLSPKVEADLVNLRNDAKADQMGLTGSICQTKAIDCDALTKRIRSEVVFVLKQEGVEIKERACRVLENRITMILKSVLGV